MTPLVIAPAAPADQQTVLAIRADAIRTGTALWTDTVPDAAEGARWFAAHRAAGSMLVARDEGDPGDAQVLGFAAVAPLRPYDGYRFTGEDSIYLAPGARGRGLGRRLLEALIAEARTAGMHSLVGNIEESNAASIALHERCGFRTIGTLPQAGWKFGRWLDLRIMQRML